MERLRWSALEYEERERNSDWFWALGIIVATASIASIIYGNYFFAALLVLGGFLLGFFAVKKPDMISYELNDQGLQIGTRLYPYENMKAFWVQVEPKLLLFINSERIFMPVLVIPIEANIAEDIHAVLTEKNVPEKEMREPPSEKIMEYLGF